MVFIVWDKAESGHAMKKLSLGYHSLLAVHTAHVQIS